jgi:molybdopterin-binding protein/molybdate transport repressor ModE-like protein
VKIDHGWKVTNVDVALLRSVAQVRSIVAASREVGISRDQAVYRLRRMARAFGGPVVHGVRGGAQFGGTLLTPLGDRIARGGFDSVELIDARPVVPTAPGNLLSGVYRVGPPSEVRIGARLRLRVSFAARDGERVNVTLDPESIVVARRRFPSSARNVLAGTVVGVRAGASPSERVLLVRCGAISLRVAITEEPLRQLGLAPGARVFLYVKATALRRVGPTRGSPRS